MDLMSSKEVQQYLRKNDMVILPVGCFEMHGPKVPLGCDAFIDWASALILAEKWKCIVLPPIFYTFPGASGPWPGTVDISPEITEQYVKAVVLALIKGGFKRVVILGSHGPLSAMMSNVTSSIFQETGIVVIHCSSINLLPDDLMKKEFGFTWNEDLFVLGALKILGLHGAYDPTAGKERSREFPFDTIGSLRKHGASVPWLFKADYQHTGIKKGLKLSDADRVVKVMMKAADRLSKLPTGNLPELFAKYQNEVAKTLRKKPWKSRKVWSI